MIFDYLLKFGTLSLGINQVTHAVFKKRYSGYGVYFC